MKLMPSLRSTIFMMSLILLLAACNKSGKTSTATCVRSEPAGDITVCLPEFEDLKECKDHPAIDSFLRLLGQPEQVILGYYLTEREYLKIDSLKDVGYTETVMVYTVASTLGKSFGKKELDIAMESMVSSLTTESWEDIKGNLEKRRQDGLDLQRPVVVDQHSPTPNMKTACMLSLVTDAQGRERYIFIPITMAIVQSRMISIAYYFISDGEPDLDPCIAKSDRFVKAFDAANQ